MKKALITGITGQDGSYLAEFLLNKGYEVHGIIRRTSLYVRQRIDHLSEFKDKTLFLHYGDMTDGSNLSRLIEKIMPDEIYNLAAQSVAEDCLCPILITNKIKYRTLKEVWDNIEHKGKQKRIEKTNDLEVEVIDLPDNKQIRALGYWNGMGTWFPIKQISRHYYKGKIAKLTQKFGSVKVTPNHSILDTSQQIKMPEENPWLLNVRKINYQCDRQKTTIRLPQSRISNIEDNGWMWEEENGTPGKIRTDIIANTSNDELELFVRFLGAFISEGHTTYNIANNNYYVGISNNDKEWLEEIKETMKWFNGTSCFIKHKKENYENTWELQIKSRALYRILRELCGTKSTKKRMPDWVFQIPKEYQKLFLDSLIKGDGYYENRKLSNNTIRYTTSSYELACQLSMLLTMCGYDYTVTEEINEYNNAWHFRECNSYQPNQGEKGKKIEWIDYDGWVYDISVDQVNNFTVGVGNIVVHNSHVQISFEVPEYSAQVDALGTIRILDAIKEISPKTRYYQACHDSETSIVTPFGIKDYKELQIGDMVYSINERTGQLEENPIKNIYIYDTDDELVRLKGKRIDQFITKNHKVLLRHDNGEFIKLNADKLNHLWPSERNSNVSLPCCNNDQGLDLATINLLDFIELPELETNNNFYRNLKTELDTNDFLYLLGLYIGDGFKASKTHKNIDFSREARQKFRDIQTGRYIKSPKVPQHEKTRVPSSTILFAIPQGDPARQKLIECLKRQGYLYTTGEMNITVTSLPLAKMFSLAGDSVYQKHIPDFVWKYSKERLKYLLDGIIDSDGYSRQTKNCTKYIITTTSEQLASQLLVLSMICNRYPSFKRIEAGEKVSYITEANTKRKITNTRPIYYISANAKPTNKLYRYMVLTKKYKGKTWCLEVENSSNFMIARNGKVAFSGNSTSELFGKVQETPQTERTPFYPRSPYAAAKLYAYWITINYREAYNLFACNGILFNHETLTYGNPLIIRDPDGSVDILPIGDIARFKTGIVFNLEDKKYQEGKPVTTLEVWDNNSWTKIKYVSGYPHTEQKNPRIINARNAVYSGTGSHVAILENDQEKSFTELNCGDKIKNIQYPEIEPTEEISLEEAEMLGMLAGDGWINRKEYRLTNKDMKIKQRFADLWKIICPEVSINYYRSESGFTNKEIGYVSCRPPDWKVYDLYTDERTIFDHQTKRVPKCILNASKEAMKAFLIGYNTCDGLKANSCTYLLKNFKTNSQTLAAGLLYLVSKVTGQEYNITVEESHAHGKQQFYYSINLLSNRMKSSEKAKIVKSMLNKYSQRAISRITGISRSFIRQIENGYQPTDIHRYKKTNNEIKKIIDIPNYEGWFFDLETESGTFHAGIGRGLVHNSPRRGENFVTRKITMSAARIVEGQQEKVSLGNLSAKRDWGYSPDYCESMWMILQHDKPDDYVIATGENHTVEEFCSLAFERMGIPLTFKGEGIDRKGYDSNGIIRVDVNPKFFRPTEVQTLLGDSNKARRVLGWEPKVKFKELVHIMADYDLEQVKNAK